LMAVLNEEIDRFEYVKGNMTTYPVQYVKGVMADLLYESVTNPASYSHHDLTLQLCAEFFDPLNYKCKDLQDSVIQTVAGTLWTVPVSIYPAFDTENPVVTPIYIATYTDTDNKKKFRFSLQIEGNNDFAKSNAEVQGMFAATQQLTPAFSIFGYKMPAILWAGPVGTGISTSPDRLRRTSSSKSDSRRTTP
jgi:hypothetical protein